MGPRNPEFGDTVTLAAIYGMVERIDKRLEKLSDEWKIESHALRNKIGIQETKLALQDLALTGVKDDLDEVKNAKTTHTGWIIGGLISAGTVVLEGIMHLLAGGPKR